MEYPQLTEHNRLLKAPSMRCGGPAHLWTAATRDVRNVFGYCHTTSCRSHRPSGPPLWLIGKGGHAQNAGAVPPRSALCPFLSSRLLLQGDLHHPLLQHTTHFAFARATPPPWRAGVSAGASPCAAAQATRGHARADTTKSVLRLCQWWTAWPSSWIIACP
jgi:hypothetical protein